MSKANMLEGYIYDYEISQAEVRQSVNHSHLCCSLACLGYKA